MPRMLVNCVAYQNGRKLADIAVEDISEYVSRPDCFVWVAVQDPAEGELEQLAEEFGLHELAVEDAKRPHQRPKLDEYGEDLFAVLRTVERESDDGELIEGQVAVFVGHNYVLSVRQNVHKGFAEVRARTEREPDLLRHGAGYHSELCGEQHISADPEDIGYDRVHRIPSTHVSAVAPVAVERITSGLPEPFFLSVGFFETHRNYFAPSSVRDTLSLLDQLIAGSEASGGTVTVEYERAVALLGYTHGALLDEVVDAVAALDAAAAFAAVDRVVQTGQDPRRFVEDLLERLRDLIVVAATRDAAASVLRGVPQDELDHMAVQAASFGSAELSRAADVVNTALTEMTGATSPRLHLELMVARLLVPATDDSERGALARVERLRRLAADHQVDIRAAALQFSLAHPAVIAAIPGASRPERIAENLALAKAPIPAAFWNALREQGLVSADAPLPL